MIQASAGPWRWKYDSGSKRNTHFLVKFVYVGHFPPLHFEESHQERKRRFRALIFVHSVRMKPIPASACRSVVKWNLQIVLA